MKTKFATLSLAELQQIYTKPCVRAEGEGFYLRKVGYTGQRQNPDLQIHVPCMGLPVENDSPINLMHGFIDMPRIAEAMNLAPDFRVGFIFCKDFFLKPEPHREICHITLCDPESASHILIITAFNTEEKVFGYGDIWNGFEFGRRRCWGSRYAYSLVPIGFYNSDENEKRAVEDREQVKREVVHLANQYLGIESETEPVSTLSQPTANDASDNPDEQLMIPGLTPGSENLRLWVYADYISSEDGFVIDKFGRLLAPTSIIDHRERFGPDTTVAEYEIWENVPEDTLVLSWAKPNIAGSHEFSVIAKPEILTRAQLERVAELEQSIDNLYSQRVSPYGFTESPEIGEGWGLWRHGKKLS